MTTSIHLTQVQADMIRAAMIDPESRLALAEGIEDARRRNEYDEADDLQYMLDEADTLIAKEPSEPIRKAIVAEARDLVRGMEGDREYMAKLFAMPGAKGADGQLSSFHASVVDYAPFAEQSSA